GTVIAANYIGTDISGSTAVPNGVGIRCDQGCVATVGAADAGNVISGNTGAGSEDEGHVAYYNNRIGVGADGVTPLGNGGAGVDSGENGVGKVVGSIALPNTIAYN